MHNNKTKISALLLILSLITGFLPVSLNANAGQDETNVLHIQNEINEVYPIDVEETEENGFYVIIRTYALSPDEDPKNIPRSDFSKYGERYVFSEITKKENSAQNKIQHIEPVTVNTPKNTMESVLNKLSPEINYEKDGFQGILKLDISSIKTEPAGYKSKTSTLTTTREYPNLSNNDMASVPKSIKQNGLSYTLIDVKFIGDFTTMIDYEQIPETYKAIATYSATSTSTNVTGYNTTANYTGEISKTLIDKIIYKVYFISEKPIEYIPEELIGDDKPDESEDNQETDENNKTKEKAGYINNSSVIPFIAILLLVTGTSCALIALFYLSKQDSVLIFNKHKGYYKKIGKIKLNLKKDQLIIDLNKLSKKIQSPYFVLELSKQLCKKFSKKPDNIIELIIKYKEDEIILKIDISSDANIIEDQYEVNFFDSGKDEILSHEE